MSFRKDKKIIYSEEDFSFKPETGITRQRPLTIRICPMFESGSAQPSSTEREDKTVPQEALNL